VQLAPSGFVSSSSKHSEKLMSPVDVRLKLATASSTLPLA